MQETLDIAEPESKSLSPLWIIWVPRHVIRHYEVLIADFFKYFEHFQKVEIALVRIDLLEIVAAALYVAQVHIEDLLPIAQVPEHGKDFGRGVEEHLSYSTDTEVEPVIRALDQFDELLYPVNSSQDTAHAPVSSRRHTRIMLMARHPNTVLGGNRDHALEEMVNPLPKQIC